jgi:hypothetical protein
MYVLFFVTPKQTNIHYHNMVTLYILHILFMPMGLDNQLYMHASVTFLNFKYVIQL